MAEQLIGTVSHWFGNISVAGIDLSGPLAVGDRILIKGHTTDFEQAVSGMQIDRQEVTEAGAGDSVGIVMESRVRVGDQVFKA